MGRRGTLAVCCVLAAALGWRIAGAGRGSPALLELMRRAEGGEVAAQVELCQAYESGNRVKQDYGAAAKWCRKAAEQGHARAQNSLGVMYVEGHGVPRDDSEAVRWFRRSAEQGLVDAQYNLSVMYANGQGVRQDDAETVKWSRLAADQGHPEAQYGLGLLYAVGAGVKQDYVQAHMWFSLAAARLPGEEGELAAEDRDLVAGKMTSAQIAEAKRLAGARKLAPAPGGETD